MPKTAKRYRVSGSQPVYGHAPGEVFERAIEDDHEEQLKAAGAIVVVKDLTKEDKGDK